MRKFYIEEALREFIDRFKNASHILPLLEGDIISVLFYYSYNQSITLFISLNEVWLEEDCEEPAIIIKGDPLELIELVEGKSRLQSLQKRGEIVVKGKYRYILKVESLFYCCSSKMMPV